MLTATVVDYGVGNLLSVRAALEHCGVDKVIFAKTASEIIEADRLILPGVGAFLDGMNGLRDRSLIDPIMTYVRTGKPLMGICLGMQMLGSESNEFGIHEGLNLIPGRVIKMASHDNNGTRRKVPFVGWAELNINRSIEFQSSILSDLSNQSAVYLVHSYHFVADNESNVLANYDYDGLQVCAAIQYENIIGLQFHPEKSSLVGLDILKSFLST